MTTRQDASAATGRRIGSPTSKTRAVIVEGAEQIMIEDGYASVTYRSVAARVGVTAGLVQYYFPSLDDLFLAVLRRGTDRIVEEVRRLSETDAPLHAIWEYVSDRRGAALIVEFMAVANHRKAIWDELGAGGERVRRAQLEALADRWPQLSITDHDVPPAALLFALTALGRMARLEAAFGTHTGHDEAIDVVRRLLDTVEPSPTEADNNPKKQA
ncbi:MAG: TetR/AcrR family transcriptional regulator [Acidimicrobiia bacterium]